MALPARRWIWRAGRKLYMFARKEEPNDMSTNGELRLQRMVLATLRPDAKLVAFDVGARIGDWSRALVDEASAHACVLNLHAFEPVPDSRKKFKENLAKHIDSGEVSVSGIALSNESTTVPFYVPHFTGGTSTLHPDASVRYEQVLNVQTSTVDRYCRENLIEYVDIIKVDTEGNDLRVIQGASELLMKGGVGVLQFEYNHRWVYSRSYLKDIFDLVRDTRYQIAKVCSTGLEVYVEWHPELERFFETNYALVHQRLTAALKCEFFRIGLANVCERVKTGERTSKLHSVRNG